jgi:hypothetical protein
MCRAPEATPDCGEPTAPSGTTATAGPTEVYSSFGTAGNWVVNRDGQTVIVHGTNMVYKTAPYEPSVIGFGNDDAAFLAENGFNAVRLGVIWAGVEPEPGVYNYAYLASIKDTVQTLADHGIYTIIDFHQDLYSTFDNGELAFSTHRKRPVAVALSHPVHRPRSRHHRSPTRTATR